MPKSKVTLFGGAFDPPHVGHQQVASYLLSQNIADQVWYVPVKQHPFGKQMASAADRLAMLELILQPNTRIEDYELRQSQISYTAWTLQALAAQHPQIEFSWIIGSDNLAKFDQWGAEIFTSLANHTFYVYPRRNFEFDPLYPGMVPLPDAPVVEAASTDIRQLIEQGQDVSALIDAQVIDYIRTKKLYNQQ
jgi:nicotinate-nucleotide adenylyltransferase